MENIFPRQDWKYEFSLISLKRPVSGWIIFTNMYHGFQKVHSFVKSRKVEFEKSLSINQDVRWNIGHFNKPVDKEEMARKNYTRLTKNWSCAFWNILSFLDKWQATKMVFLTKYMKIGIFFSFVGFTILTDSGS